MGKESTCNAGDAGRRLIPGSGRFPGEGHGNPLQCSCLENPQGQRGAWWATVHGVVKGWTRLKQISTQHKYFSYHLISIEAFPNHGSYSLCLPKDQSGKITKVDSS